MTLVHRNIAILRKRNGYTQETLADKLKITRARIGAYEESRNEPNLTLIIKMAKLFNVSISRLITYKFKK